MEQSKAHKGGAGVEFSDESEQPKNKTQQDGAGDPEDSAQEISQKRVEIMEEDLNRDFEVGNPEEKGSHIEYLVKGVDRQGTWQGARRYNHFHIFYEVLMQRWPGINLPRLPPKKAIGRYEVKFLMERRFFLERFIRKCGQHSFIANSEEFIIFSRPNGDVEKVLQRITKLPTSSIIDRYHRALGINEKRYDLGDKATFGSIILDFQQFANKTLPQLKDAKIKIRNLRDLKQTGNVSNKQLFKLIENYEMENALCYESGMEERLVFTSAKTKPDTAQSLDKIKESLVNPIDHLYYWIKGEIYDIKALLTSIQQREAIEKQIKKTKQKKADTTEDLDKMQEGKTSMRTMFKNSSDTTGMQKQIEVSEREIENLSLLFDLITIYLGEEVIPTFKKRKATVYKQVMGQVATQELSNCFTVANFWTKIHQEERRLSEIKNKHKDPSTPSF